MLAIVPCTPRVGAVVRLEASGAGRADTHDSRTLRSVATSPSLEAANATGRLAEAIGFSTMRTGSFLLSVALVLACATTCAAQDLEPRAYVNTPVGMNFFVAGYTYTTGGVALDSSLPIEDADIEIHGEFAAYARSFGWLGRSGKFDAIMATAQLDGTATVAGVPREREVSGLADSRLRVSYNLYGAPALTLEEHQNWHQDLLVGVSLQMIVPTGQYDDDKAVNLGSNRWAFKPEIGVSKAFGKFILELDTALTIYTDNDDYLDGKTREQDPLFAAQAHLVYSLHRAVWAAFDVTYYVGGETAVDGVQNDDELSSVRVGGTVSLAVSRRNSIKLYASGAGMTRYGSDFTTVGVAWQYRWGGGI